MLSKDLERLFAAAKNAMKKARAPYSGFKVGASVISEDGSISSGFNIENPSLTFSMCAERTALINALAEGKGSFKAVAVVSNDGKYCPPCGSCRQMLLEFAPEISIYLVSEKGIKKSLIEDLLPGPFVKDG